MDEGDNKIGAKKQKATPAERLARKLEKREKQRASNLVRASKMHAARLALELPEKEPNLTGPGFHVGCAGWFYWHWRGSFYPDELPTKSWFDHYATNFSTVELNAPFYSWPTVHTVQNWLKQVEAKDFVYTVKVCELITHVKRMSRTRELVRDFGLIADLLGERMGCFLFQLPPSYHYSAGLPESGMSNVLPRESRPETWLGQRIC